MDRTLHAFQLHAHIDEAPLENYRTLFERIGRVRAKNRERQVEDRVIALSDIQITKDYVIITVQDGDQGVKPLFYDRLKNEERVGDKNRDELLSTRTHAVLDLRTRYVTVEFNMRGAKASHVLALIWMIAQKLEGMKDLTMEMPPIIGGEFLQELEKYSRIRVAQIKMVRPNSNWEDCVDKLASVSEASNAQKINVEFIAVKGQSLNQGHGIIATVKSIAKRGLGIITNATLWGHKQGSSKEVPLKLKDHTDQRKVTVEKSPTDGYPEPKNIQYRLIEYLEDLRKHQQQVE